MDSAVTLHIVALPWVGFSHLNPFLELSKRIAQLGHRLSFLSTPTHVHSLAAANPDLHPSINLVALRHPDHAADDDRPGEALDALEAPVADFLRRTSPPPDWILFDSFCYWVPRVAARLAVPCAFVNLIGAAANAFMWQAFLLASAGQGCRMEPEQLTAAPSWAPFPTSLAYRRHEAARVLRDMYEAECSGVIGAYRVGSSVTSCDAVAVRSCHELEPEWLALLGRLCEKPVLALGHFPPAPADNAAGGATDGDHVFRWLGEREVSSVVYVAFGSEEKLTREQMHELSRGLELSNLPFVWALRSDGSMLPPDFEERIRGRGLVCHGWVPQVKILAHPSVGGFMTHCGWNSLVEALQFGLALVLLPFAYDQGLNARLMVDKKVGVEVPRREDDGFFTGVDVAKTLRLVMMDKEGEECRARAKEMKDVLGKKDVHDRYVKNFVEYLKRTSARAPKSSQ